MNETISSFEPIRFSRRVTVQVFPCALSRFVVSFLPGRLCFAARFVCLTTGRVGSGCVRGDD